MKKITLSLIVLLSCLIVRAQLSSGLIAKYYFNTGTTSDDLGQRNGINHGATLTKCRFGHPNHAFYFDGSGSYIELPADYWVTGDFTASGWAILDSNTNFCRFFEFGNGINADNVFFAFNAGGSVSPNFTVHNGPSSYYRVSPWNDSVHMHTWQHIAVTLQGYNVIIYRNGQVWAAGTLPYLPGNVMRSMCYMAKSNFGAQDGPFKGALDDIRFYNRALSATEIDSLYTEIPCGIDSAGHENVPGIAAKPSIGLYPNPVASDNVWITGTGSDKITNVYVFGNDGHLVKVISGNTADRLSIPVGDIPAGIYFIKAITAAGSQLAARFVRM